MYRAKKKSTKKRTEISSPSSRLPDLEHMCIMCVSETLIMAITIIKANSIYIEYSIRQLNKCVSPRWLQGYFIYSNTYTHTFAHTQVLFIATHLHKTVRLSFTYLNLCFIGHLHFSLTGNSKAGKSYSQRQCNNGKSGVACAAHQDQEKCFQTKTTTIETFANIGGCHAARCAQKISKMATNRHNEGHAQVWQGAQYSWLW